MSNDRFELQVRVPGVRQDILAVGYGQFEFGPPLSGLVALWSLKNPGYPLWSFPTPSGVTAVDFSVHNPNMLAVGLYDGTLAVHDVKTRQASFHLCNRFFAYNRFFCLHGCLLVEYQLKRIIHLCYEAQFFDEQKVVESELEEIRLRSAP